METRAPEDANDGTKDPLEASRKVVLAVRVAALLPIVLGFAVYALHPGVRGALNEGVSLMVQRDLPALREWGRKLGPWAWVGTTVLMVVEAFILPIPAILVTWTNSWLFGPLPGGFLSITQATLAALICFLIARAFGEPLVVRLISRRVLTKTHEFMARQGSAAVLVARLIPFVPFKGVSYVAGLTRMRVWPFVWATWVGQIPAGIAFSYLGQEVDRPASFAVFGITVILALFVFAMAVKRATRAGESSGPRNRAWLSAKLVLAALLLAGAVACVFQLVRSRRPLDWTEVKGMVREKFPEVRQISTGELALWLADSSREPPLLVDARSREEFEISSIASATLVTEKSLEDFEGATRRNQPIVVYCSVGYRSSRLARQLAKDGFRDVQNLEGSIFQWANERRPLVHGASPATKVHPYDAKWGRLLDPEVRADVSGSR